MLNKYFGHTNIASTQNVRNGARPHGEGDEEQPLDDDMACRLSELATLYIDMLKLDDAKTAAQLCWRVMFANVKRGRNILAYRPHSE